MIEIYREENAKLKSIISDIEEWVIIQYEIYKQIDKQENSRISCHYLKIKDKIQELKEKYK